MNGQASIAMNMYRENDACFPSTAREKRRDPCEIEASLVPAGTSDPVPCFIENISAGGAQIRLHDGLDLPPRLSLLIPISLERNETRECEILWGEEDVMGVKFLD